MTHIFSSPQDALNSLHPDEPLYCLRTDTLKKTPPIFLNNFKGITLYAFKFNPHPELLKTLYEIGIRHFDTASLSEIKLIKSLFPDAHCAFMHPVKSRAAIKAAYFDYGIRHFVVDSFDELSKLDAVTHANDLVI